MNAKRDAFDQARAVARAVLDDYGIDTIDQLATPGLLDDLAWARRVQIVSGDLVGASGRLMRVADRGVIRLRDDGSMERRRFSVAHELGHFELRHGGCLVAALCSDTRGDGDLRAATDVEAITNVFAAELLMPEALVLSIASRSAVDLGIATMIGTRFATSLEASARRLVEITEAPCAVVLSQRGQIRYSRRSRSFKGWIVSGRAVNPGSVAGSHFAGCTMPTGPRAVPAAVWDRRAAGDAELVEHSIALRELDAVVTLVWSPDGQRGDLGRAEACTTSTT